MRIGEIERVVEYPIQDPNRREIAIEQPIPAPDIFIRRPEEAPLEPAIPDKEKGQ